jgi:hypothetical protein
MRISVSTTIIDCPIFDPTFDAGNVVPTTVGRGDQESNVDSSDQTSSIVTGKRTLEKASKNEDRMPRTAIAAALPDWKYTLIPRPVAVQGRLTPATPPEIAVHGEEEGGEAELVGTLAMY